MDNLCICCGESVPEGHQVCRECETKAENKPKRNIDALREMSAKELATVLCGLSLGAESIEPGTFNAAEEGIIEAVAAWLEKEVEGDGA